MVFLFASVDSCSSDLHCNGDQHLRQYLIIGMWWFMQLCLLHFCSGCGSMLLYGRNATEIVLGSSLPLLSALQNALQSLIVGMWWLMQFCGIRFCFGGLALLCEFWSWQKFKQILRNVKRIVLGTSLPLLNAIHLFSGYCKISKIYIGKHLSFTLSM